MLDWSELPDIMEVYDALRKQAELKAQLRIAKLTLEIYQAKLSKEKPRDASVKLIGIDDESRAQLENYLKHVAEIEGELDRVDADVKFNSHRIDASKAISYKMR